VKDQDATATSTRDGREPVAPALPPPPTMRLEPVPLRGAEPVARWPVAQTTGPPPRRAARVSPRVWIGAVALVLAVALVWATTQAPPELDAVRIETFAGRGISFTYVSTLHRLPADRLEQLDVAQMSLAVGDANDAAWREVFAMNDTDVVLLFGRDQPYLVDHANIHAYESAVVDRYEASGIEPPRTRTVSVDALAALSAVSNGTTPSGVEVQIRTTEVFAEGSGYVLVCQAAPDRRAELMAACDVILRTVKIQARTEATSEWTVLTSGDVRLSVPSEWQEAESLRRGTEVAASLPASAQGTTAARVEVVSVRLRRPVPTGIYADIVADRMRRYLVGRGSLRIDGRPAAMLRLEDRDAGGVFYLLVDGRTAYAVRFDIPIGNQPFTLLRPTMDAIAHTLDLR
jgi:hypothetical protein